VPCFSFFFFDFYERIVFTIYSDSSDSGSTMPVFSQSSQQIQTIRNCRQLCKVLYTEKRNTAAEAYCPPTPLIPKRSHANTLRPKKSTFLSTMIAIPCAAIAPTVNLESGLRLRISKIALSTTKQEFHCDNEAQSIPEPKKPV
jgi:hypothetical protein